MTTPAEMTKELKAAVEWAELEAIHYSNKNINEKGRKLSKHLQTLIDHATRHAETVDEAIASADVVLSPYEKSGVVKLITSDGKIKEIYPIREIYGNTDMWGGSTSAETVEVLKGALDKIQDWIGDEMFDDDVREKRFELSTQEERAENISDMIRTALNRVIEGEER